MLPRDLLPQGALRRRWSDCSRRRGFSPSSLARSTHRGQGGEALLKKDGALGKYSGNWRTGWIRSTPWTEDAAWLGRGETASTNELQATEAVEKDAQLLGADWTGRTVSPRHLRPSGQAWEKARQSAEVAIPASSQPSRRGAPYRRDSNPRSTRIGCRRQAAGGAAIRPAGANYGHAKGNSTTRSRCGGATKNIEVRHEKRSETNVHSEFHRTRAKRTAEFPVLRKAAEGPDVFDIRKLYSKTRRCSHLIPGFTSTASPANPKSLLSTAKKGVLLYRGYPIDQLAENWRFSGDLAYLLLNAELPDRAERRTPISDGVDYAPHYGA